MSKAIRLVVEAAGHSGGVTVAPLHKNFFVACCILSLLDVDRKKPKILKNVLGVVYGDQVGSSVWNNDDHRISISLGSGGRFSYLKFSSGADLSIFAHEVIFSFK